MLQLIRQIVKTINDERQSAQSFLLELNQTLTLVQGALQNTLASRTEFHDKSGVLNQQLQADMKQLNDSVETATHWRS